MATVWHTVPVLGSPYKPARGFRCSAGVIAFGDARWPSAPFPARQFEACAVCGGGSTKTEGWGTGAGCRGGAGALARIEGVESSRRLQSESLRAPAQAQNRLRSARNAGDMRIASSPRLRQLCQNLGGGPSSVKGGP